MIETYLLFDKIKNGREEDLDFQIKKLKNDFEEIYKIYYLFNVKIKKLKKF